MDSMIGKLEFGAPVVYPMKCCIRRFREAMPKIRDPEAMIPITQDMRDEAEMWLQLLPLLNGVPLEELYCVPEHDEVIEFDASNKGFGAYWAPYWLSDVFEPSEVISNKQHNNIAWRELFALTAAFAAWGQMWSAKRVIFYTDNTTVFSEVCRKDSKNRKRMSLIRRICFISAKYSFRFYIEWVKRDKNEFADALSKLEIERFKKLCLENDKPLAPCKMLYIRPTGLDAL